VSAYDGEEPRTHVDMIRDLRALVAEREWVTVREGCFRGCCSENVDRCARCSGKDGTHTEDCGVPRLLLETEAFLRAEDEARG
jgi:cytochrome c553